jgi:hypothetical protein
MKIFLTFGGWTWVFLSLFIIPIDHGWQNVLVGLWCFGTGLLMPRSDKEGDD